MKNAYQRRRVKARVEKRAEHALKTAKLASARYLDTLPTAGSAGMPGRGCAASRSLP